MTTRPATAPATRLEDIARRLAALPRDKQQAFVEVLEQRGISVLSLPIVPQPRPEWIPLSFAQQRLWLLDQLHPGSSQYNIARIYALSGPLDLRALERALAALVERHEALRTRFVAAGEEPAQRIEPAGGFELALRDLSALAEPAREPMARELAEAEAAQPFDLARGPVFRAQLVRLAPELHWLLVTSHHIAMDEWSEAIIAREVLALYDAYRTGRAPDLAPPPIQYADYALWQRRWLTDDALAAQLAHWRAELGTGEHEPLLAPEPSASDGSTGTAASHHFALDAALCERLRGFAARTQTTLFTAMLAAFQVVLHKLSGQTEIRVGSPIANRHRREVESVVGCFANTLVLRAALGPTTRFAGHLDAVKRTVAAAQSHQDLPFERLVESLAPDRDLASTPLFQVMFSWHRGLTDQTAAAGALAIGQEALADRDAKFDLVLHMTDDGARLTGELQYRAARFSSATIAAIAERLERVAAQVIDAPERRLAGLAWLSDVERSRAVHTWNATDADPRPARSVHGAVAAWAAAAPDAPAVQSETRRLSYRELDDRAARIAGLLAARGVRAEYRVGLCIPRSHDLIAGLVGILKAGAAYVPLDPRTPPERLRELVADAGIAHIVATTGAGGTADRLTALGIDTLAIDDDAALAAATPLPGAAVSPDAAAYVIYTSGSTGRPKGVVVPHGALASYAQGLLARLALPAGASMALVSTPTADLGNTVLFGALVGGCLLHVVSEDRCFDPDRMSEYVRAHGIDVLKITPSHLGGLLQAASPGDVLPRHTLVLGGESASADLLARIRRHGGCRIVNHYGPTETTVGVLTHDAGAADDAGPRRGAPGLPLGRPLPDRQAYVLDAGLAVVPPGVYGELYIGGAGVARGYLGRPGATADRFIPDPFRPGGGRLYRTGDRARYLADGSIEFAGRTDDQIKLRGHRIEPGEVRAALLQLPGVADAHVMLSSASASPRLVAYLVRRGDAGAHAAPDLPAITAALAAWLPEHMIPSDLVWLERFPLTANGKLDRRALPEPGKPVAAAAPGGTPRNDIEQLIAEVWREVLAIDAVGVDDNFFSLGGDSLLAFQVVARLRKAGATVTIPQLFAHQTIAALARVAQRTPSDAAPAAGPAEGAVALTPIQHWLLDPRLGLGAGRSLERPHHFNQSVLLELTAPIEPAVLEAALSRLAAHHDGLRLRFHRDGDAWQQTYAAPGTGAPPLEIVELGDADPEAAMASAANRAQRSLDLASGPVMRAVLFRVWNSITAQASAHNDRLLLIAHHLIVDGVSWRILLEDLAALIRALATGVEPVLPAATASYQAWSAALSAYAHGAALAAEAPYWHGIASGDDGRLPGSRDDRAATGAVQTVTTALDEAETAALLSIAPSAYRTQIADSLLTALAHTLCEWTGRASAVIQLENHGREPLFPEVDTSRTVGWFTAAHPLRLTPRPGDVAGSIKQIKEQLRAIPHRGIGHGVLRYLARDSALAGAAPELTFNYLGQFDATFDPSGPLRPASGPTGDDSDPAAPRDRRFDVIGLVQDRRLQLDWQFCPALDEPQLVERLAARYVHHLRALIAHCSATAHRGVTPSDFPLTGLDQAALDGLWAALASRAALAEVDEVLPLTPIQEGILFHCLAAPGDGLYVTQRTIEITSALDLAALRTAWNAVAAAHDVLRTGFALDGLPRPVQIVWRAIAVPFEVIDMRQLAPDEQTTELGHILEADRKRGFDLSRPPLMRVTLVQTGDTRAQLIWTDHHLLLDGWSSWRVLGDVLTAYQAIARGDRPAVRRSPPSRDHIAWLAALDAAAGHAAAEAFWRAELGSVGATWLAPQLRDRDAAPGPAGYAREARELSPELTEQLRSFAQAASITVNTLVQGAVALAIAAATGRDEVVFGVTVSGRSAAPGPDDMVGLFINTLPLRVALSSHQSVAAWLGELQRRNAALREYEHTPLARVQRWTGAQFDTLLVFENYPIDRSLDRSPDHGLGSVPGLLGIGATAAHARTNYPLALEVSADHQLTLQLDIDLAAVGRTAAHGFVERVARALELLAGAGDRRLGQLSLVTDDEHRALAAWNRTAVALPRAAGLPALIEAQVDRAPDAIAIVDRDRTASYRDLDARANQLAWRLLDAGVGPESIVGICAPRSIELVVGLLGILKAGAAYLPLDPAYPVSRIEHMLADARPAIVLAGSAERDARWVRDARIWPLDELRAAPAQGARPPGRTTGAHMAYCIYTSGSTGLPKGVAVSHENLINFLAAMASRLEITPDDGFLALTSLSFDIAALELWLPLTRGARIVLAEREEAGDAERLLERLAQRSVSVVQATPTTWRTIGQRSAPVLPPSCKLLCGGEALPPDLAARLVERAGSVINVYGPTETTVWSTLHVLDAAHPEPSIGRPVDNTAIYVLDAQLRPVPPGTPGELYIGGLGVARGYLRRPALTAERFLPDPFSDLPGARMYRTGDLGRHRPDGTLECLGRTDDQIKLRGHRIELGEIETRLRAQPGVAHAAVAAREVGGGEPQLIAYVVPDASAEPDAAALEAVLRRDLAQLLPAAMLPQRYGFLSELPRTANGKLDRKALPAPSAAPLAPPVAPRDDLERSLTALWQRLLGRPDPIGVHDDFFALGGDSLIALQVIAGATSLGLALAPRDLFEHPTIARLAAHLAGTRRTAPRDPSAAIALSVLPAALAGSTDASTDSLAALAESRVVTLSVAASLGSQESQALLERAMRAVEDRHDALRLRVRRDARQLRAWIGGPSSRPPSRPLVQAVAAADIGQAHDQARRHLHLGDGPLVSATWLDASGGARRALITAHVLAADPASWPVLLADLETAVRQLAAGAPLQLSAATGTFGAWLVAGAREQIAAAAPGQPEDAASPSTPSATHPSTASDPSQLAAPTPAAVASLAPAAHARRADGSASTGRTADPHAATASSSAHAPHAAAPSAPPTLGAQTRHRVARALDEHATTALHSALDRHRLPPDSAVLVAFAQALGRWREPPSGGPAPGAATGSIAGSHAASTAGSHPGSTVSAHAGARAESITRASADRFSLHRVELESVLRRVDRDRAQLAGVVGSCTAPIVIDLPDPGPSALDAIAALAPQLGRTGAPAAAHPSRILVRWLGALDPATQVLPAPSPHPLIATGAVERGAITITIEHDDRVPASQAAGLASAVVAALGELARGLTDAAPRSRPQDFAHVALEAGELDDLLGDLS